MPKDKTDAEAFFDDAQSDIDETAAEHAAELEIEEWEPTTPSVLRGYFMKATRHLPKPDAKYKGGPMYKVYLKDYDTKLTITVFCARKMLLNGILEASPKKGTLMVFEYKGKKEGKSGYDYYEYHVRANESDSDLWAEITRPRAGEFEERERAQAATQKAQAYAPGEAPF